jgi:hypothetical protein
MGLWSGWEKEPARVCGMRGAIEIVNAAMREG